MLWQSAMCQILTLRKPAAFYSLNDMKDQKGISVRKDENIEKAYMSGKYGAIPFIQNEEL